ncbi:hypothetical protein OY671_008495, partial [Metschnikowia pulcherrima]
AAAVPDEPGLARPDPRADLHRGAGAAVVHRPHHRGQDGAGGEPAGPVPDGHGVVQPGAWRVAVGRGRGDHRGRGRDRHAGQRRDALPGRGAGVPELAVEHAVDDPGGDRHHVHRAGRAVRKLPPPDHHPVDAAVGRGGGVAGAADQRHRARHDRHHRHHPADRHRQEERDHDDRRGDRRRADPGGESRGRDPGGSSPALPADHDDHHVRAAQRPAADAEPRPGLGVAPAAGLCDGGRPDRVAGADAVHDAGGVPVPGPGAFSVHAQEAGTRR